MFFGAIVAVVNHGHRQSLAALHVVPREYVQFTALHLIFQLDIDLARDLLRYVLVPVLAHLK